jgi:hypothetical protein
MVSAIVGSDTQKRDHLRIPSSPPPSSETPERFTGRASRKKQAKKHRVHRQVGDLGAFLKAEGVLAGIGDIQKSI